MVKPKTKKNNNNLFRGMLKYRRVLLLFMIMSITIFCINNFAPARKNLVTQPTTSSKKMNPQLSSSIDQTQTENEKFTSALANNPVNITNDNSRQILSNASIFTSDSCKTYSKRDNIGKLDGVTEKVTIDGKDGSKFSIHAYMRNDIVSNEIRGRKSWETDKIVTFKKYFMDYSKEHDIPLSDLTFLDIGANIGWFSLSMAAFGVNVLAFEPMEENLALIKGSMCFQDNIDSSVSDRITLFGIGLGPKDLICTIYSGNINTGDGHVECDSSRLNIPEDYAVRGSISVRRLDDVISALKNERGNITVVSAKIDTEGYEANLLEGGEKFLLGGEIDRIVTEFDPTMIIGKGGDPVKFMKKVYDAGYKVGNKAGGYMSREDAIDMKNFGLGFDPTLHSPKVVSEAKL